MEESFDCFPDSRISLVGYPANDNIASVSSAVGTLGALSIFAIPIAVQAHTSRLFVSQY